MPEIIELKLTVDEAQIVMCGLGKLPAEVSFDVKVKLQKEIHKPKEEIKE